MTRNKNNFIKLSAIVLCVFFIVMTQKILANTSESNEIDPTKPILDFPNDYKVQGIFVEETHRYNTSESNEIDPTKPILDFPNDYKVQGIFIGETHRYCIINNHILEIGSKISDIKITDIDSDGVYIETSSQDRFQLNVNN